MEDGLLAARDRFVDGSEAFIHPLGYPPTLRGACTLRCPSPWGGLFPNDNYSTCSMAKGTPSSGMVSFVQGLKKTQGGDGRKSDLL